MSDLVILSAKVAVLDRFFAEVGFGMPNAYRTVLGHPELLPGDTTDILTEPSKVILLNLRLRDEGWSDSKDWPHTFLAIGEDPAGNILFFDSNGRNAAVWLADHETSAADRDALKCTGMAQQADSFGKYIADRWHRFLEHDEEPSGLAQRQAVELQMLNQNPHPLLLENYFYEVAIPYAYDAAEAWKHRGWDRQLFSNATKLSAESAHRLLIPAAELAARQRTYGRFRAAIGLMHNLLRTSRLVSVPENDGAAAREIISLAEVYQLDDFEPWNAIKAILNRL